MNNHQDPPNRQTDRHRQTDSFLAWITPKETGNCTETTILSITHTEGDLRQQQQEQQTHQKKNTTQKEVNNNKEEEKVHNFSFTPGLNIGEQPCPPHPIPTYRTQLYFNHRSLVFWGCIVTATAPTGGLEEGNRMGKTQNGTNGDRTKLRLWKVVWIRNGS